MYILGFDIGGTKCAVITARYDGDTITLLKKAVLPTDHTVSAYEMIDRLTEAADGLLEHKPDKIGVSCGGPLDSQKGLIMSPPNLPMWDNIEIVKKLNEHYGAPTKLQNDANACAVAEWLFGAGVGCDNMVFMTFGTGIGAGLILNGKLYEGTNGMAGEVGHIRLADDGPVGYRKEGSFEGFCSGGGIAQLGYLEAKKSIDKGVYPLYFNEGDDPKNITAKSIAMAAEKGDPVACEVYRLSGKYLGRGISILIDILNPEKIVIGGIFARSGQLLIESMQKEIEKEALSNSVDCCTIVSAKLGEEIGDYSAIATAIL